MNKLFTHVQGQTAVDSFLQQFGPNATDRKTDFDNKIVFLDGNVKQIFSKGAIFGIVDSSFIDNSTHAVQSKVIKEALDKKLELKDIVKTLDPTEYNVTISDSIKNYTLRTFGAITDWGDGTIEDTSSFGAKNCPKHAYANAGDFVIKTYGELVGPLDSLDANYLQTSDMKSCLRAITRIKFGNSVTAIPNWGFSDFFSVDSITEIVWSPSITKVGIAAFYEVNGANWIGSFENVSVIMNQAFRCNVGAKTFILNYVADTADNANGFSQCRSAEYLKINSINNIKTAFIGFGAGASATEKPKIKVIDLPADLQSVVRTSFSNINYNNQLEQLIVRATTPPTVSNSTTINWGLNMTNIKLYVPKESVDLYKAANGWKQLSHILPIPEEVVVDTILNKESDNPVSNKVIATALEGISTGGGVVVDTELSDTSENPVQNKVVKTALAGKVDVSMIATSNDTPFAWDIKSTEELNKELPTSKAIMDNFLRFLNANLYSFSESNREQVVDALLSGNLSKEEIYAILLTATGQTADQSNIQNAIAWELFDKVDVDLPSHLWLYGALGKYLEKQIPNVSGKANTADLATVATSGSYNDLEDKPTIPSTDGFVTTETEQSISGAKTFTKNVKLTDASKRLYTLQDLQDMVLGDNSLDINASHISAYISYILGTATSSEESFIFDKLNTSKDSLVTAEDVLRFVNSSHKQLSKVATSGSYKDLTNKPTIPKSITVDSELSNDSTNPVQNKVITAALGGYVTKVEAEQTIGNINALLETI